MTHTPSHPIINQRYQVQKTLGKGGIGITYEALDLQQNTLIALKEISLQNLTSAKKLELLEREIEVLQQLNHPQIPAYLDYFEIETKDNKTFYIVQQLAQGKNLHQWGQEGGRVSEKEVKDIAVQILQILDYLHSFNPPIIHRDIKPQNLVRSSEGKIYLVDFGAVQNAYYTTFLGGSTTIGTFGYMPLEQANGNAVPASDLYSLGATLLYLITRRSPEEFCQGLRFQIPNNLNLSEDFMTWLETLLEPDIDDRFSSAKEALTVLQNHPSKKETKKIRMVRIGLVAVTLSSLFLFYPYKWAILNHLGFPAPVEVCYNDKLTDDYWESGGRLSSSDFEKCLWWSLQNTYDDYGWGRSNYSTRKNRETMAKWLINHGADIHVKDNNGKTPLHHALSVGNSEIIELLIKNGAKVSLKDGYGKTPFMMAVYSEKPEIVELLIKGGNINLKNEHGKSLLYQQTILGNSGIVKVLIKNGVDIHVKDKNARTPLHYAASYGSYKIAELLIKNGADIHVKDKNDWTPLHYTAFYGSYEIAELLIKNGADVHIKDNDSQTPLDYAKSLGNSEIVELLIKNGAKD